jgi:hypothetical protein
MKISRIASSVSSRPSAPLSPAPLTSSMPALTTSTREPAASSTAMET